MKLLWVGFGLLAAALVVGAEVSPAERLAAEERLGEQAERVGRFSSAVRHYRQALELTPKSSAEHRGELLLKLAQAQALIPDVDGALESLREFNALPTGKPSDFAIATDQVPASGWMAKVFKNESPERRALALCLLGEIAIVKADYSAAEAALTEAAKLKIAPYEVRAQLALIYAAIHRGELNRAQEILSALRSDAAALENYEFRWWTLNLLLAAKIGDSQKFIEKWENFRQLYSPTADPLVAKALGQVGNQLIELNLDAAAERLLTESFYWQISDDDRREVLQQLFSVQIAKDETVTGAARTAERYDELFPDGPDRWNFLARAAHEMQRLGKFAEALKLYRLIVDREVAPMADRLAAMREAANVAEFGKNDAAAREMYQKLLANAQHSRQVVADRVNFGGYLYRTGKFAEAVAVLALLPDSEAARKITLDSLIRLKKWNEATTVAERLIASPVAATADFGRFRLAEITEYRGDLLNAREQFLKLRGDLAEKAAFRAAYLAWRAKLELASAELEEYAEIHPKAPNAPVALFLAMQSKPDWRSAEQAFHRLVEKYPESVVIPGAVRQLAEYLAVAGQEERFFALLEKYRERFKTPAEQAEWALVRFRGMAAFGKNQLVAEEAAPGGVLSAAYVGTPVAGEIAFLAGDCYARLSNYPAALQCYERALELHRSGRLGECAQGRCGIMLLELFSATKDSEKLAAAEEIFRKQVAETHFPDLRLESLYQLAKCRNRAGDGAGALDFYEQTLSYANELRSKGIAPEPSWCANAVKEALTLLSTSRQPGHITRGLRIINLFETLGLPGSAMELSAIKQYFYDEQRTGKRRD